MLHSVSCEKILNIIVQVIQDTAIQFTDGSPTHAELVREDALRTYIAMDDDALSFRRTAGE